MLDARKWPGGGKDEDVRFVLGGELSVQLRESQIVANAESEAESRDRQSDRAISGREALVLFNRRRRKQMRLAILARDLSIPVDHHLRVVNRIALAFGNAADNPEREALCDSLQLWHCALRHGVALRRESLT